MSGFKASEEVEELSYDFNPFAAEKGVIPEPTSDQIDAYRQSLVGGLRDLGVDPQKLQAGVSLDEFSNLMEKSKDFEDATLAATAELTGLSLDVLKSLPYRVQQAFLGWMMGLFFSPEG